jgi:hypothetical protein
MNITSGVPSESPSTYAPCRNPEAGEYFARSTVGKGCRLSISAIG